MNIKEQVKQKLIDQGVGATPQELEMAVAGYELGLQEAADILYVRTLLDRVPALKTWREIVDKSEARQSARKKLNVGKGQAVHHLDGNPLNNDPANLMIVDLK